MQTRIYEVSKNSGSLTVQEVQSFGHLDKPQYLTKFMMVAFFAYILVALSVL